SGLAARQAMSAVGSVRNVAVAALTKNLADELGPAGVNVTVIHPGFTVTERTPETLAALAAARGVSASEAAAFLARGVVIGRLVTAGEVAGRPRRVLGAQVPLRKVRAPLGRVVGNTDPGRPAGKCHRK